MLWSLGGNWSEMRLFCRRQHRSDTAATYWQKALCVLLQSRCCMRVELQRAERGGFNPSMKNHFSESSRCIFPSHCGCSSRSRLCLTFASNEPCRLALFKLHKLYFKQCVKSAKRMKVGKKRAGKRSLLSLCPSRRTPLMAPVWFLSASRLSPWLSAQRLARPCHSRHPARLAAHVNSCFRRDELAPRSRGHQRESTAQTDAAARLFVRHGPCIDPELTELTFPSPVFSPFSPF